MFDFAISKNQQPRPTRRLFASWSVSCAVHILLLFLLIQYPELLRGGMYHRFRPVSALANLFSPQTQDDETKDWRTVAVIKTPLIQPSAATLKKYMKDWNAKNSSLPPSICGGETSRKRRSKIYHPCPRFSRSQKRRLFCRRLMTRLRQALRPVTQLNLLQVLPRSARSTRIRGEKDRSDFLRPVHRAKPTPQAPIRRHRFRMESNRRQMSPLHPRRT